MNEEQHIGHCQGERGIHFKERTHRENTSNLNEIQTLENDERTYKCPHAGHLNGTDVGSQLCPMEGQVPGKSSQYSRDDGKTCDHRQELERKDQTFQNCDERVGLNFKPAGTQQNKKSNTDVYPSQQQQCSEYIPRGLVLSNSPRYCRRERHRSSTPLGSMNSSINSSTGSLSGSAGSMSSSYGPSSLSESLGGAGLGLEGQSFSYSSRTSSHGSNCSLQTSRASTPINSSHYSSSTAPTSTPVPRRSTRTKPRQALDSSAKFLSVASTTSSRRSQSRCSTPLGSSRSRRSRSQTPRPKCESDALPTPGLQQEAFTRAFLYPSSLHTNLRLAAMFFVSAYVGYKTMKDFFLSLPIFRTATVNLSPTSVNMGLL